MLDVCPSSCCLYTFPPTRSLTLNYRLCCVCVCRREAWGVLSVLVKAVRGTCSKSIFSALHSNYPPPRSLHEFMLHADTSVSIKCDNQRTPAMYVDFIHLATRKKKKNKKQRRYFVYLCIRFTAAQPARKLWRTHYRQLCQLRGSPLVGSVNPANGWRSPSKDFKRNSQDFTGTFMAAYWNKHKWIIKKGMKNTSVWDTCSISTDGRANSLGRNKACVNSRPCTPQLVRWRWCQRREQRPKRIRKKRWGD